MLRTRNTGSRYEKIDNSPTIKFKPTPATSSRPYRKKTKAETEINVVHRVKDIIDSSIDMSEETINKFLPYQYVYTDHLDGLEAHDMAGLVKMGVKSEGQSSLQSTYGPAMFLQYESEQEVQEEQERVDKYLEAFKMTSFGKRTVKPANKTFVTIDKSILNPYDMFLQRYKTLKDDDMQRRFVGTHCRTANSTDDELSYWFPGMPANSTQYRRYMRTISRFYSSLQFIDIESIVSDPGFLNNEYQSIKSFKTYLMDYFSVNHARQYQESTLDEYNECVGCTKLKKMYDSTSIYVNIFIYYKVTYFFKKDQDQNEDNWSKTIRIHPRLPIIYLL